LAQALALRLQAQRPRLWSCVTSSGTPSVGDEASSSHSLGEVVYVGTRTAAQLVQRALPRRARCDAVGRSTSCFEQSLQSRRRRGGGSNDESCGARRRRGIRGRHVLLGRRRAAAPALHVEGVVHIMVKGDQRGAGEEGHVREGLWACVCLRCSPEWVSNEKGRFDLSGL
jgi:hypothetical protein